VNIEKFDPIKDNAKVYGLQTIRRILSDELQLLKLFKVRREATKSGKALMLSGEVKNSKSKKVQRIECISDCSTLMTCWLRKIWD